MKNCRFCGRLPQITDHYFPDGTSLHWLECGSRECREKNETMTDKRLTMREAVAEWDEKNEKDENG